MLLFNCSEHFPTVQIRSDYTVTVVTLFTVENLFAVQVDMHSKLSHAPPFITKFIEYSCGQNT